MFSPARLTKTGDQLITITMAFSHEISALECVVGDGIAFGLTLDGSRQVDSSECAGLPGPVHCTLFLSECGVEGQNQSRWDSTPFGGNLSVGCGRAVVIETIMLLFRSSDTPSLCISGLKTVKLMESASEITTKNNEWKNKCNISINLRRGTFCI